MLKGLGGYEPMLALQQSLITESSQVDSAFLAGRDTVSTLLKVIPPRERRAVTNQRTRARVTTRESKVGQKGGKRLKAPERVPWQ